MILVCCFIVHYWAYIFYYATTFNDNPKETWIRSQRPLFLQERLDESYVDSLYWSIVTFATVKYGDWHTITFGENICTIVYLLHNLVIGVYILGYIINWMPPGMGRKEEY